MSVVLSCLFQKTSDEGGVVKLYRDDHNAWFVGKVGDPQYDPIPIGAFRSKEAAQRWADHKFSGGTWGASSK